MTEGDGLYLNNVWVSAAEGMAVTYQANDLTKPASIEASYTNEFALPDTLTVRTLLENAEQLDAGGPDPYRRLRAQVVSGGETTFLGFVELSSFSGGWTVTLYEESINLFDRLDRPLSSVDLGAYDHPWTVDSINTLADAAGGVCYPLIDYGLLSGGVLPVETVFPAAYVHTVVGQMLYEEGYRLVGNLPADPLYQRLVLPFSETEPTSHDQTWRDDRYARVTWERPTESAVRSVLGSGSFINRIQTYDLDNLPDKGFYQGRLHNYDPASGCYVADSSIRVRVEGFQRLKLRNIYGSLEALLIVEKNGQAVGETQISTGTGYNLLRAKVDVLKLDETITCKKGDRLRVRLIVRRQTRTGDLWVDVFNGPDDCGVSFTPDLSTQPGDTWLVSRNLPGGITGKTLLINLAYLFGGTWSVNAFRREVSFSSLTAIVQNAARAVDWSERLDTGPEPGWVPRIDPYGQNNLLRWKETEETKKWATLSVIGGQNVGLNYGDGNLTVTAEVLPVQTDLLEMAFGASTASEQTVPGYGSPVLVKIRTLSGTGENVTVGQQSTAPRLLLVSPGESFPTPGQRLDGDGVTVKPVTVNLKPCWFGTRPDGVRDSDTRYNLCFSPVSGNRNEQTLLDRYYEGLRRVLRRMRVLTMRMRLWPEDIAGLDFERPVLLQRLQPGSLIISQHYFYLNKISNYQDGRPCPVTLIAFDPLNPLVIDAPGHAWPGLPQLPTTPAGTENCPGYRMLTQAEYDAMPTAVLYEYFDGGTPDPATGAAFTVRAFASEAEATAELRKFGLPGSGAKAQIELSGRCTSHLCLPYDYLYSDNRPEHIADGTYTRWPVEAGWWGFDHHPAQNGTNGSVTLLQTDACGKITDRKEITIAGSAINRIWIKDVGVINDNYRFQLVADATGGMEYYVVEDGTLAGWSGTIMPVSGAPTSATTAVSHIARGPTAQYTPLTLKLRVEGHPGSEVSMTITFPASGQGQWVQIYPQ